MLTYQRQDLLRPCLDSLAVALAAVPGETELVVVDNASPGNVATGLVHEWCAAARVVTLEENLGYSGGIVAGLEAVRGRWVLTIGDDATIAADAVVALLAAGESAPDVGSVAAKLIFADTSRGVMINSAGIEVDSLGVAVDRLLGEPNAMSETEVVEIFGTSGGGALYRRAMLDSIGGFEASFELYLEDVDVAWRARRHGWRCLYAPAAVVHHHHSATTGHRSAGKYFHVGRNRVRLLARNATASQLRRYGLAIIAYDTAYVLYALVSDRTLAPVRGRRAGLRFWRADRRFARTQPAAVELVPPFGLARALDRGRAWLHGGGS